MSGRLTALSRSVAGKRVIVTGAASGMGRATAHLFADEGASVAVVDLQPERVLAVTEVEKHLIEITALEHDPRKFDAIEQNLVLEPLPTSTLTSRPL